MRRCLDAPLAHLIGTPAKRAKEIGAPSLKHPFARVFAAIVTTSPLANSKWCNGDPFDRQPKILAIWRDLMIDRKALYRSCAGNWQSRTRASRRSLKPQKVCGGDLRRSPTHPKSSTGRIRVDGAEHRPRIWINPSNPPARRRRAQALRPTRPFPLHSRWVQKRGWSDRWTVRTIRWDCRRDPPI